MRLKKWNDSYGLIDRSKADIFPHLIKEKMRPGKNGRAGETVRSYFNGTTDNFDEFVLQTSGEVPNIDAGVDQFGSIFGYNAPGQHFLTRYAGHRLSFS